MLYNIYSGKHKKAPIRLYLNKTNKSIRKDRYGYYRFDDAADLVDNILFL